MSRFSLGEFRRTLDDRYRVSVPAELTDSLGEGEEAKCVLAKEHPGALSLWNAGDWGTRLESDIKLVRNKLAAGHLRDRLPQVQVLGRLLSTRHREVSVAGRGRLVIPEGFREFLAVEPGGDVLIVGAAICIEIWKPEAWISYLSEQIPQFSKLLEELAG
jgi:MraZ protein